MGLGRLDTRRVVWWATLVALLIASSWSAKYSGGPEPAEPAYDATVAYGSLVQFAVMIALTLLIARGAWSLLALRRPLHPLRALPAAAGVLIGVALINAALSPFLDPGKEQGLTPDRWEPKHAVTFAAFALAVVVGAPLAEELLFRGLGFSLLRPLGVVPPIVGTAVLWCLAHALVQGLPVFIAFGIGLAWLRSRQDSVIPGMIAHATFNGLGLLLSLTT